MKGLTDPGRLIWINLSSYIHHHLSSCITFFFGKEESLLLHPLFFLGDSLVISERNILISNAGQGFHHNSQECGNAPPVNQKLS